MATKEEIKQNIRDDLNATPGYDLSSPYQRITPLVDSIVDRIYDGVDFKENIIAFINPVDGWPANPDLFDRYIATATANGRVVNHIYEGDGSNWIETVPDEGLLVWVETLDAFYFFDGTSWQDLLAVTGFEPLIAPGTALQYLRGDKVMADLSTTAVAEGSRLYFTNDRVRAYADTRYSLLGHNHDSAYAALGHNHDNRYSLLSHTHDYSLVYAAYNHNHSGVYAAASHASTHLANGADRLFDQNLNRSNNVSFAGLFLSGDVVYSVSNNNYYNVKGFTNTRALRLCGGTDSADGATIAIHSNNLPAQQGNIRLEVGRSTSYIDIRGRIYLPDLTASTILELDANRFIVSASKNSAYNKIFGTAADTVCQGNDSRLSDARTPTAHGLISDYHTASGLTPGHFLKATGAGVFGFAAHGLSYDDVGAAAVGHSHSGVYEPVIGRGTTLQYFRGDLSLATMPNSLPNPHALTLGTGLTGTSYNGSAAVTAAVSYGSSAGTACQGNDSRLYDARVPLAHDHNAVYPMISNVFGSLTSNYLPRYNGSGGFVNSPLYHEGTNLIRLGSYFSLWGSDENETYLLHNMYYGSSAWRYRTSITGSGANRLRMAGGSFLFSVAGDGVQDEAVSLFNAFYISSIGRVGIGTTSPLYQLHVGGNTRVVGNIGISNALSNPTREYYFYIETNYFGLRDVNSDTDPIRIAYGARTDSIRIDTDAVRIGNLSGAMSSPSKIRFDNSYSNGITRDKCKIELYSNGPDEIYGFGIGSIGDVQYHSNAYHDFYINNVNIMRISTSSFGLNGRQSIMYNSVGTNYSEGNLELIIDGINFPSSYPLIGFHRAGVDAMSLVYTGGMNLAVRSHVNTTLYNIWTSGNLTGDQTGHYHDSRYFTETELSNGATALSLLSLAIYGLTIESPNFYTTEIAQTLTGMPPSVLPQLNIYTPGSLNLYADDSINVGSNMIMAGGTNCTLRSIKGDIGSQNLVAIGGCGSSTSINVDSYVGSYFRVTSGSGFLRLVTSRVGKFLYIKNSTGTTVDLCPYSNRTDYKFVLANTQSVWAVCTQTDGTTSNWDFLQTVVIPEPL